MFFLSFKSLFYYFLFSCMIHTQRQTNNTRTTLRSLWCDASKWFHSKHRRRINTQFLPINPSVFGFFLLWVTEKDNSINFSILFNLSMAQRDAREMNILNRCVRINCEIFHTHLHAYKHTKIAKPILHSNKRTYVAIYYKLNTEFPIYCYIYQNASCN